MQKRIRGRGRPTAPPPILPEYAAYPEWTFLAAAFPVIYAALGDNLFFQVQAQLPHRGNTL